MAEAGMILIKDSICAIASTYNTAGWFNLTALIKWFFVGGTREKLVLIFHWIRGEFTLEEL